MIDDSDGDFFGLMSMGTGGWLGVLLAIAAIVLWVIAACNEVDCEAKSCPGGAKAKLLDHACVCVTAPIEASP
jgi:hypothetical protein